MSISKKELRRIAQICLLDFSDDEYDSLKLSLETTIQESEVLFQSDDFNEDCVCKVALSEQELSDISRKNFSFSKKVKSDLID